MALPDDRSLNLPDARSSPRALPMMSAPTRDLAWKEIHHRLVPLMRPDNRTNLPYLAREYVLLGLILAACGLSHARWADGTLPIGAFAAIAAVGVFAVGAIQHRFSALA